MGISTEQLIAYREREVDNATGFKAMLSRLGEISLMPGRVFIPGISPEPEERISDSTKMLLALARRPDPRIYHGTVPSHVVARRRAKNRAARAARRVHRR